MRRGRRKRMGVGKGEENNGRRRRRRGRRKRMGVGKGGDENKGGG